MVVFSDQFISGLSLFKNTISGISGSKRQFIFSSLTTSILRPIFFTLNSPREEELASIISKKKLPFVNSLYWTSNELSISFRKHCLSLFKLYSYGQNVSKSLK